MCINDLKMSFWSSLPKSDDENYEGVITKNKPKNYIKEKLEINDHLTINTITNGNIDKELFKFILNNGVSPSGNSYLVNPNTLLDRVYTYLIDSNEINMYLGFAVSIPHAIKMNSIIIETGLTTYLTVSTKHRKEGLAKYLIADIISYGWSNNIYTGYHYIVEPRTSSNILVYTYFRPLNILKALECGYQFNPEQMILNSNSDYTIRQTVYDDFLLLEKVNRKMNIYLTEKSFQNLSTDCKFYTTLCKSKVTGIVGIKPVLLKIGKTNTLCNVARVVYLETLERHVFHSVSKIINYLTKENFVVMSGVCFGNLTNDHIKYSTGIITSGKLYLDFYNLSIKESNRHSGDINLLYI
jgi:hypothetical protein